MDYLLELLDRLYTRFPMIEKVTTYAGPRSTLNKSPDELRILREAGLRRAYIGIETGDGKLLKKVGKGVDDKEMGDAIIRLREAGMDVWGMFILGLGGKEGSKEHIQGTIDLINRTRPHHISALTLMLEEGTKMYDDWQKGKFNPITADESLIECRDFIAGVNFDPIHFTCDHASNYVPLNGTLRQDSEKFIKIINDALSGKVERRPEEYRGF
ncbi:MAG: radical SAM protein [Oscillospiraceae bacterium]|nr:radical SAM protein [Oscillospiraceae bacterium]